MVRSGNNILVADSDRCTVMIVGAEGVKIESNFNFILTHDALVWSIDISSHFPFVLSTGSNVY
jgi:hypothetical protein